jgi:hypothetical protein
VIGRGNKRTPSRLGFWLGGLLVAAGLAFPAGASALDHPFLGTFCEPTGVGTAPCEPSFIQPSGMAVEQSNGDLLVIDFEAGTVSRFHSDGTPADFSALGTNVIDGIGTLPCTPPSVECDGTPENEFFFGNPEALQIAVDNSGGETDGNIYVTQAAARVVDIFDSDGSFLGQLSASSEGAFEEKSCGVAVDPSGSVYVSEFGEPEGEIHKYDPAGPFPENADNTLNFAAPTPCTLAAGAGPTAGSVFVTSFEGPIWKFNGSTGANEGENEGPIVPGPNVTVTVNPDTGHLYVAAGSAFVGTGRAVNEYDASGSEAQLLSSIVPPGPIWGIAVDAETGNVYVAQLSNHQIEVWGPAAIFPEPVTGVADSIGPNSATLNGTVNPNGVALTECFFEYDTVPYAQGEAPHGKTAPCEPNAEGVGSGSSPVAVQAEISGLEAGQTYHFRLVVASANTSEPVAGEDEAFLTLGASIKDEAASLITATSARLSAQVNPNGEETTFVFEYVSQAQFEDSVYAEATVVPDPPGAVGSGSGFKEVGVQLLGLQPDTTYHFRIVATTPNGTAPGPDRTFTTFATNPNLLPDGRAYELVSPPQKIGEVYPPEPIWIWTGSCINCLPGVSEGQTAMQVTDDGQAVAYEGSPFSAGLASGPNEYLSRRSASGWSTQSLTTPLFSAGLEKQGYQVFSEDLSRAVIYQIEPALTPDAPIGPEGKSYANLYLRSEDGTLTPLVSEAPPNRDAGGQSLNGFATGFAGANAGSALVGPLHHVIFEANDALTPEAPPVAVDERNLYEWAEGELRLVNLAPNGDAISGTVFGSGREIGGGESGADFDGAISDDGSRIFFSERESGQVYVRIDGEETREISDPGKFLVASGDGGAVLLSNGCLYGIEAEGCEAQLSQGEGGFEGILGATKDLSTIYFVDTAALTGESEENANGDHAEEGEPNLYSWQEGATKYIATLLSSDNKFNGVVSPQVGDWMPSSSSRTAQVSPDGRFLAFMSRAPLTGYDNRVRVGDHCRPSEPAACAEVFEYRADEEELLCASCNPSGERPLGTANLSLINRGKFVKSLAGYRQPTNLTANEGRLFFESQDSLALGDINANIKDVYQWEPQGVGDCTRAAGCTSLISTGHSPNDSIFLDASASGDDAFFITRERLLPPDQDEKLDLYDARVGGGIKELPLPPCGGEPCRGPSTPAPAVQAPPSGDFTGSGNVHPKKHKKKHHRKHKHHKKHHHKHGGRG